MIIILLIGAFGYGMITMACILRYTKSTNYSYYHPKVYPNESK